MGDADKNADIRQPSINTEPRTLDESTMERAMAAAQKIMAENPKPSSDCFTKDATDMAVRQAPAQGDEGDDALGTHLDDLVEKIGNIADVNFKQNQGSPPSTSPSPQPPT